MKYLLDTNICIFLMKNSFPSMTDRMLRLDPDDFAVSSITLFELEYGAAKSKWGERTRDDLYAFLSPFAVLPFDPDDAGLRILSWRQVAGRSDLMEATFLPGPNRAYSAERASPSETGRPTFELRPHRLSPDKDAVPKNYLLTGNEDPEVRIIYLYKEGASSLYRLRLE